MFDAVAVTVTEFPVQIERGAGTVSAGTGYTFKTSTLPGAEQGLLLIFTFTILRYHIFTEITGGS